MQQTSGYKFAREPLWTAVSYEVSCIGKKKQKDRNDQLCHDAVFFHTCIRRSIKKYTTCFYVCARGLLGLICFTRWPPPCKRMAFEWVFFTIGLVFRHPLQSLLIFRSFAASGPCFNIPWFYFCASRLCLGLADVASHTPDVCGGGIALSLLTVWLFCLV